MALTALAIKNLKPKANLYRVADGGGLCLEVAPSGGKLWRWRYRFNGKAQLLALGKYPAVSLEQARKKRDGARELVKTGKHPTREKDAQKLRQTVEGENTFEKIARRWMELKNGKLNEKYRTQSLNSKNHIAESQRDDFDERAAMIAANGHENSWVKTAAALFTMPRPVGYAHDRWQQILDDAGKFLDCWGREAAALAWKATDVCGVCPYPDAPECRYDGVGLVPLLKGHTVCDIDKDTAWIDCGGGITQTFQRKTMAADTMVVWNLVQQGESQ